MPNTDNETPAITAANAINSSLFWGYNGEWWDGALLAALIVVALVAGFVVVATAGQIISHKREAEAGKEELERFKSDAHAKFEAAAAELENAKNAAKQIDANLLHEQRLTASERWRLERLERAVLPRSAFVNWQLLTEKLKIIHLDNVSFVKLDTENFEAEDFARNLLFSFQEAGTKVSTSPVNAKNLNFFVRSSSGLSIITADDKGERLAEMLWRDFQVGGGSSSLFPKGHPEIPRKINCLVIGPNNWAMSPSAGQAGEGLDQFGRPVPAPQ